MVHWRERDYSGRGALRFVHHFDEFRILPVSGCAHTNVADTALLFHLQKNRKHEIQAHKIVNLDKIYFFSPKLLEGRLQFAFSRLLIVFPDFCGEEQLFPIFELCG